MSDEIVTTKAGLLSNIEAEFKSLSRVLEGISEVEMTSTQDSHGWTVKDHIAHLTGWARLAWFFFQGKPPHVALGVDQALYLEGCTHRNYDQINEVLREQTRELPLGEVMKNFRSAHEDLFRLLETLEDEDLKRSYRHYLPEEPGEWGDTPAINVAYGNSAHHYKEHREWIQSLVTGAS